MRAARRGALARRRAHALRAALQQRVARGSRAARSRTRGHILRCRSIHADWFEGDPEAGAAHALSALACFSAANDAFGACLQYWTAGSMHMHMGRFEQALALLAEGLRIAESDARYTYAAAGIRQNLGYLLVLTGDLDAAERCLTLALEPFARANDRRMLSIGMVCLAKLELARGKPERAFEHVERALREVDPSGGPRVTTLAVFAEVALALGRTEDALRAADEAVRLLAILGVVELGQELLACVHAEALFAAGEYARARQELEIALRRLRRREPDEDPALSPRLPRARPRERADAQARSRVEDPAAPRHVSPRPRPRRAPTASPNATNPVSPIHDEVLSSPAPTRHEQPSSPPSSVAPAPPRRCHPLRRRTHRPRLTPWCSTTTPSRSSSS
ncbi:MAG: hypothetical protein U0271_44790 [Polyangiaceae bacterium]